jgi:hypothetical protein
VLLHAPEDNPYTEELIRNADRVFYFDFEEDFSLEILCIINSVWE